MRKLYKKLILRFLRILIGFAHIADGLIRVITLGFIPIGYEPGFTLKCAKLASRKRVQYTNYYGKENKCKS